ncbi:MAG: LCP family protein [Anaerolineales bacterium]|nr:LCP family protein [Anaerolineales bacterium]
MDSSREYKSKPKKPLTSNWLLIGLVAAFILAGVVTVWLTFSAVKDLVSTWNLSSPPGVVLAESPDAAPIPEEMGAQGEVPLQNTGGPPSVPWDGNSRINVLVMGMDSREADSDDIPRTDTMILFSMDPQSRTAGMLSIPRDLWVEIPGFDYSKINTAYRLGEVYKIAERGPGLALDTVENLLGMEIDYYAIVDFNAFEDFIDELGGVTVLVPEKIVVDPLGKHNTETLKAGEHLMPGYLALAYARSRNSSGSDFDRAGRQQQVVMAIRDQILSAEMLPNLIKNSPALYQSLSSGISSNLTLMQLVRLAWVAQQIPGENIRQGVIGVDQVDFAYSYDGQDILRPLPDEIRQLRDLIFSLSGPVVPMAPQGDTQVLVDEEYATLMILNGTYTAGLASQSADYLRTSGLTVAEPGNANEYYEMTTIIDYTGNPHTVAMIVELMSISAENVFHRYDVTGPADVVVIVGQDWADDNPME